MADINYPIANKQELDNLKQEVTAHKEENANQNLLKQQVVLELSDGTKNEFTINENNKYEMKVNLGWCRLKDLEYFTTSTAPTNVDEIRYRRPSDAVSGALTSLINITNMEEVKGTFDKQSNVGKYTTVGTLALIQFIVNKGTTREDFESSINMDNLVIYKLAEPYTVVMPDNISANTRELIRLSIESKRIEEPIPGDDTPQTIVDSGLGQSPYHRNYKIIEFDHSKWVATSDTPSLTVETDREFVKFGYDSLKIIAHPTETTRIEYEFDEPIDLSNKYMNLWVYIPNNMMKSSQEIKFSTIGIYYMTPQGWVNQWQDRGYHRYEGIQPIVSSPHTLNHDSAGGNGDMTQVSKIRVSISKEVDNTEPIELYINAMSTYDFVNKHYMSIEFDDALPSVFNVAFPEMSKRGIRGGVWVITQNIHNNVDGSKPWQLLKFQDAGWDVGSHTVTHPNLSEISEEEQLYELKQSQQDLIDIGIYRGSQFFVAPSGDSTLYSRKVAKTIYANWRMTGWRIGNGVILEDPYLREGITIASRGVEGTKTLIDQLVSKPGGYLPIVAHGEIGGTFAGYSFTAEEFGEILDYALSKGVEFITVGDMFPNTEIRR